MITAPGLIEFLRARLNIDELAVSRGECRCGSGPARPDCPDRVLADVQAKRKIIDEAEGYHAELEYGDNGEWAFDCVLRLLALPYADHLDYREEWRPAG
jgi:hypothetical protein